MARSGGGFALGKPATRLCPECGSRFTRTLLPFEFEGKPFGFFPADVCENGHQYFPQDSRRQIQEIAKALGLWGSNRIPTTPPVYGYNREVPVPENDVVLEETKPSAIGKPSTSGTTITLLVSQGRIKRKMVLASV